MSWSFLMDHYYCRCFMSELISLLAYILLLWKNKVKEWDHTTFRWCIKKQSCNSGLWCFLNSFLLNSLLSHYSGGTLSHSLCPRFGSSKIKVSLMILGNRNFFFRNMWLFPFSSSIFYLKTLLWYFSRKVKTERKKRSHLGLWLMVHPDKPVAFSIICFLPCGPDT